MKEWFIAPLDSLVAVVLSAAGIYISVIVFTRISGKRSFSTMSSFDFTMTVAVGSLIATTLLSASVSLLQGIVGLGALYLLQFGAAILRRNPTMKDAIDNTPQLLVYEGKIFKDNLKKVRLTEGDLRSKLRESNVMSLQHVKAVVFETTGDVSVIHSTDPGAKPGDWLLEDVKR